MSVEQSHNLNPTAQAVLLAENIDELIKRKWRLVLSPVKQHEINSEEEVKLTFVLDKSVNNVSVPEMCAALLLNTEDGELLPGYTVDEDYDADRIDDPIGDGVTQIEGVTGVYVEYKGLVNQTLIATLGRMADLVEVESNPEFAAYLQLRDSYAGHLATGMAQPNPFGLKPKPV